jgi:hypothetical protein
MPPFFAELIGTMILVTPGDGVVVNALLDKSKGQNGGWVGAARGCRSSVRSSAKSRVHSSAQPCGPRETQPNHQPEIPNPK